MKNQFDIFDNLKNLKRYIQIYNCLNPISNQSIIKPTALNVGLDVFWVMEKQIHYSKKD